MNSHFPPAVNTQSFAEIPLLPLVVAAAQVVLVGFATFSQSALVPSAFVTHVSTVVAAAQEVLVGLATFPQAALISPAFVIHVPELLGEANS